MLRETFVSSFRLWTLGLMVGPRIANSGVYSAGVVGGGVFRGFALSACCV